MSLLTIAAVALQFPAPNPAEAIEVQGPSRICIGQISYDAEAGETVALDYAGVHWAGIRVHGPEGTFFVRTGDMLDAPRELRFRVRGTDHRRVYRYPTWNAVDTYRIFGRLAHDPSRDRPIALIEARRPSDNVARDVIDRIATEGVDPTTCNHRLDFGRRMGERG